jgi:uncharacterized protein YbjT (DUF2867 family)
MILVIGATGSVGREAVKLLVVDGAKAAAVARDPATVALPEGAHVVGGHPARPATLASALHGFEAILLSPRAVGTPRLGCCHWRPSKVCSRWWWCCRR